MRTVGLALLVMATGCNWFFGLDKTNLLPGDATDAPPGHGELTYWLAVSHPSDVISFPPIDGAMVEYGKLDGELVDAGNGADGFTVNESVTDAPDDAYRLVYHLPGDPVPHEIQWGVTSGIRLAVPRFGRLERTAPVAGSGYKWTIAGCTPPCFSPPDTLAVLTTGVWMEGSANYNAGTGDVTFAASTLSAFEGTPDHLDFAGNGDTFVLAQYPIAGNPPDQDWSLGGYMIPTGLRPLDTSPPPTEPGLTWQTRPGSAHLLYYQPRPLPPSLALNAALGPLFNMGTLVNHTTAGVVPDLVMPTMTEPGNGDLPRSVFYPLDNRFDPIPTECVSLLWPWNPDDMSPDETRPVAVTYRQVTTRSIAGVKLASGFEEVAPAIRNAPSCSIGTPPTKPISFDIGIAQIPTFNGTKLAMDSSSVMLPAHGFATLEFDIADGREVNTSDCIATLYKIDTSKGLVPVYSVQVLAKTKNQPHFPTDGFVEGVPYVFGIECRSGYPNAASGDYTVFSGFPQETSQVFPGSFTVALQ